MTGCPDWQERLQGLIDGELDAAHAAEVEAHVAGCAACAQAHADALALRTALRGEGARADLPDSLALRLEALVSAAEAPAAPTPQSATVLRPAGGWRRLDRALWGFGGAGLALAACAVLALSVVPEMQTAQLEQDLVAGHVRSQLLQSLSQGGKKRIAVQLRVEQERGALQGQQFTYVFLPEAFDDDVDAR